jgi:hypothetical protein
MAHQHQPLGIAAERTALSRAQRTARALSSRKPS